MSGSGQQRGEGTVTRTTNSKSAVKRTPKIPAWNKAPGGGARGVDAAVQQRAGGRKTQKTKSDKRVKPVLKIPAWNKAPGGGARGVGGKVHQVTEDTRAHVATRKSGGGQSTPLTQIPA